MMPRIVAADCRSGRGGGSGMKSVGLAGVPFTSEALRVVAAMTPVCNQGWGSGSIRLNAAHSANSAALIVRPSSSTVRPSARASRNASRRVGCPLSFFRGPRPRPCRAD